MKKMWLPIITIIIVVIIIGLIILKKTNHLYFNNLDTYKVVKVEDRKDISGKGIVFPEHVKVYKINKNIFSINMLLVKSIVGPNLLYEMIE